MSERIEIGMGGGLGPWRDPPAPNDCGFLRLPKRTMPPCTGLPTLHELAGRAAARWGYEAMRDEATWALTLLNNTVAGLGHPSGRDPAVVAARLAEARLALIQLEALYPEADHEAAFAEAIRRREDRLASGGPQGVAGPC